MLVSHRLADLFRKSKIDVFLNSVLPKIDSFAVVCVKFGNPRCPLGTFQNGVDRVADRVRLNRHATTVIDRGKTRKSTLGSVWCDQILVGDVLTLFHSTQMAHAL